MYIDERSTPGSVYQRLLLAGLSIDVDADGARILTHTGRAAPVPIARFASRHRLALQDCLRARDVLFSRARFEHHRVDGREVAVVDGVLSAQERDALHADVAARDYSRSELDSREAVAPTLVSELDLDRFRENGPLALRVAELARRVFPRERHRLIRAYVNLGRPDDRGDPHRDCRERARDITVLCYANRTWRLEYGGHTRFYEACRTRALAVLPRPGRVVLFRGALLHSAEPPVARCPVPRFTVALKFRSRKHG